jgi:hypothetical protein
MKCQLTPAFLHQTSMALQMNSVPLSETIEPGLPRRATIAGSSRATRRPEIEVSGNPAEIKSEGETRLRLRALLRAQSRRAFLLYNQAFWGDRGAPRERRHETSWPDYIWSARWCGLNVNRP